MTSRQLLLSVRLGGHSINNGSSDYSFDPKYGWVEELDAARAAVRKSENQCNPISHARVARACFMLRQFRECQVAANLALCKIEGSSPGVDDGLSSILQQLKQESEYELGKKSMADKPLFQQCIAQAGLCIEQHKEPHSRMKRLFTTTNIFQYAGLRGDMRAMEALVAAGSAIDFPFENTNGNAPLGASLLVILCAHLAMYASIIAACPDVGHGNNPMLSEKAKQQECAVQLVWLGADFKAKLELPNETDNPYLVVWRNMNLNGLTARELAVRACQTEVVQAMDAMTTREDRIARAHCRCGSRLPWKKCHIGKDSVSHFTVYRGQLHFLYSPLARCPCTHTTKAYNRCCLPNTARPLYLRDADATFRGSIRVCVEATNQSCVQSMERCFREVLVQSPNMNWGDTGSETWRNHEFAQMYRSHPERFEQDIVRHSQAMATWDIGVYTGCLERMDKFFLWSDSHWSIDRQELLVRVNMWNKALQDYVHLDSGLSDPAQQQAVIRKHTAVPFAPCANPTCGNVEKSIKEFAMCGKCRNVAYCSKACLKQHWKSGHKICCSAV